MLCALSRLAAPRTTRPASLLLQSWPHTIVRTAKKAAVAKGEPAAAPSNTVRGLNIIQGGSDPGLRPDSEYPDWLWTVHEPLPSLGSLQTKVIEEGADALSDDEKRRMLKQWNRQRIRERNAERKR